MKIDDLASEHDILILEDDPYYFLQYGDNRPASFLSMVHNLKPATDEFLICCSLYSRMLKVLNMLLFSSTTLQFL